MNLKSLHARLDKLEAKFPVPTPAVVRTLDISKLSAEEQHR